MKLITSKTEEAPPVPSTETAPPVISFQTI